MRISRRVMVLASGGVIGALVTVGAVSALSVATASTPSVTYFACLNAGTLSHVGTTAPTCASPATRISWNSVGPQGAQGPKGATGARGAAGLNGSGVRSGATVPPGACKTGDTFVAITSPPGEVYNCVASAWHDSGDSIQGPQGGQGPQGPQGVQGVQGPAGIATGVTTGRVQTVPVDTGSTAVTVLTAPAVPTSGIYYITASVTLQVADGDTVACATGPNQIEAQTAQFGAPASTTSAALPVNGALSLTSGQTPHVDCIDATSDSGTNFLEGSLNVTLIGSSNASPSSVTRANRFPLKIVRAAK